MKITVETEGLRQILLNNLEQHKSDYKEALEKFHVAVEEEAKEILKNARERTLLAPESTTFINAPKPKHYSKHYERAIDMLDLHAEEHIVLDVDEYKKFVDDQWDWSRQFEASTKIYNSSSE